MTRVHDTARWISYILCLAQLYFVSKNAGWRILRRNILNCSWESTLRYSIPRCWPFRHFFSELWSFAKFDRKIFSLIKVAFEVATSVTRLGDLLDFGQLLKAFGSNYFAQISHILGQVKPPLGYFYRQLAIFSGHTGGDLDRTSKAQLMFQHFLKKGLSRPLFFFIFVFSTQMFNKSLPMTGFEPRISGVGGDCSTNWATTTTHFNIFFQQLSSNIENNRTMDHRVFRFATRGQCIKGK